MTSKAKVQQLENKWLDVRNKEGEGSVALVETQGGLYKTLEGRILTKNEYHSISKDCAEFNKLLVIIKEF